MVVPNVFDFTIEWLPWLMAFFVILYAVLIAKFDDYQSFDGEDFWSNVAAAVGGGLITPILIALLCAIAPLILPVLLLCLVVVGILCLGNKNRKGG